MPSKSSELQAKRPLRILDEISGPGGLGIFPSRTEHLVAFNGRGTPQLAAALPQPKALPCKLLRE